jgi:hypothetical protein
MRNSMIATCLLFGLSAARGQDEAGQAMYLTARLPEAEVLIYDEEASLGVEQLIVADDPLPISFAGEPGTRRAIFNLDGLAVTLVVNAVDIELMLRGDGGLDIAVTGAEAGGWIDVYHMTGSPLTVLNLPHASIGLPKAVVRAEHLGDDVWKVTVVSGKVGIETDSDEAGAIDAGNATTIGSDGGLTAATAVSGMLDQLSAAQSAIAQSSLLPDFVRVAEAVAEGDIEPPTRASRVVSQVVAPVVRVKEIVPRGGVATQVEGRAVASVAAAAAQSTAEAFFEGDAALAVVGARLQRTRVIGTSGVGGRALRINPELTVPFLLRPVVR